MVHKHKLGGGTSKEYLVYLRSYMVVRVLCAQCGSPCTTPPLSRQKLIGKRPTTLASLTVGSSLLCVKRTVHAVSRRMLDGTTFTGQHIQKSSIKL